MTGTPERQASAESVLAAAKIRPAQREALPPCSAGCVAGGDVRGWLGIVAQRRKLGLSDQEAYRQAWNLLAAVNPFPATMGRVCPHPCEAHCSRHAKDGAVSINALERFLGDWALAVQAPLPRLVEPGSRPESIGVIGAGPAGLSFACQMARRGYRVTVYEREATPGGMLYFGIPQYRLPEEVLASEIARILDLGVELCLNAVVGRDVSVTDLRQRHQIVFLGIGAGRGLALGIPGEEGAGSWTGTGYLSRVNRGMPVKLGTHVVVVGGGNTAVDAARTARRTGAEVTMLYRRTRREMPAIEHEVEDALAEGVEIAFLTAPLEINRADGAIRSVLVQRMALGEPDASGRRAPVPIPGSEHEVNADSVIAAVSQQPEWDGLGELKPETTWVEVAPDGKWREGVWVGGDTRGLGVAGSAIGHGRLAAEAVHAHLRGLATPPAPRPAPISSDTVKPEFFAGLERVTPPRAPAGHWRVSPEAELQGTISEAEFLQEASRCFSCGLCFGCEQCFMYCNAEGVTPLEHPAPGRYFALALERCQACGKCVDLCPCGFLSPS